MRAAVVGLALAAVTLAACSDDSEESAGSATVQAGATVPVRADEYSFRPGRIAVRGGPRRGSTVRLRLRNEGSLPHDIHVRSGDDDRGGTRVIGDGETAEASLTLPPGEYETYCSIGDHAELGMKGTLTVE